MKLHPSVSNMKQIKISIRTQLLILVLSTALLSLLVLAVVTGVYFTDNLVSTSLEKLQIISQLKSSQLSQTYYYFYYQLYSLSAREDIKNALTTYKAGNTSADLLKSGEVLLHDYIESTLDFFYASLYGVEGDELFSVSNEAASLNLSSSILNELRPLTNATIPLRLKTNNVLMKGPVMNGTNTESYVFSLTLPVYSNSSIIIATPDLAGYMTVIINAASMRLITTDTSALESAKINLLKGITSPTNLSDYKSFVYAFEPALQTLTNVSTQFPMDEFPFVRNIFETQLDSGYATKMRTPMNATVLLGYSLVQILSDYWVVLVEQDRNSFLSPMSRFAKIIVGVVIGLAVLVCIITFPLLHYGVRPIMKLQKATEELTYGRGMVRYHTGGGGGGNGGGSGGSDHETSSIGKKIDKWMPFWPIFNKSTADSHLQNRNSRNSHRNSNRNSRNSRNPYPLISPSVSDLSSPASTGLLDHFVIPHRIEYSRSLITDELSELTELFNAMTDELDRQYTHLEDRVRERTRELEKLKVQAESADELKTVFISQISHELRTPLNGILGLCSVCIAEDDPTSIKESLKLIFRSGELLLHILTELLTFSKNTLNKSKLENKEFKVLEISWQIKSIFGKLAFDQNVDLTILIKPNLVRKMVLFGDSNRIIQVLMNLVSNSLKFTPVDGKVEVTIRCLGEYDELLSKAAGYKKVLVKLDGHLADDGTKKEPLEVPFNEKLQLLGPDNDDLQSLHTIATLEYNNAIFESQFKRKSSARPLKLQSEGHSPTSTTDVGSSSNESALSQSEKPADIDDSTLIVSDDEDYEEYDDAASFQNKNRSNSNVESDGIKHYKVRTLQRSKVWVLEFVVEDTGPGIEDTLKDKVFEPFIQGDQTLSRSHGGTGLGLSICRQLATMMHGTLELESTVGKGSRFTFRIPLEQVKELVVRSKREEEDLYNDEFNSESKKNRHVTIVEPCEMEQMGLGSTSGSRSASASSGAISSAGIRRYSSDSSSHHDLNDLSRQRSLLKLNIASTATPITLQLLSATAQSPSLSIQSSSYFVDKPSLLTKSSTGTAHSLPSDGTTSPGATSVSTIGAVSSTTPNVSISSKFPSPKFSDNHIDEEICPDKPQLKILVAEDNQVNQEVIRRMLSLEGFKDIKLACDGQELIDILQKQLDDGDDFDLIFMDVQMPKLDGVSATIHIRKEMKYTKPIVALTAYADESNVTKCLESGMSGFLAKPIRRGQLKKIIQEYGYQKVD